jgi:hypothetical protein
VVCFCGGIFGRKYHILELKYEGTFAMPYTYCINERKFKT